MPKDIEIRDIYLRLLLRKVEDRLGYTVKTSRDYLALSEAIKSSGSGSLSPTTLKRVWGYVRDTPGKHLSTLDTLSRFAGYPEGFHAFCRACDTEAGIDSGFAEKRMLDVFSLRIGEGVRIYWAPQRMLVLRAYGNCLFEVEESKNSKLKVGTRVRCARIIEGDSLVLDVLDSSGAPSLLYEAGKVNGIAWCKLSEKEPGK